MARLEAKNIQAILDSPFDPDDSRASSNENKYFDIVSFDPRGVRFTTPSFICFPDALQRAYWEVAANVEGLLDSSNSVFELMWTRSQALGDACYSRMAKDENGDDGLGAHMNTLVVARDMVAIIGAFSRLRKHTSPNPKKSHKLANKLQYWGLSYGTLLGQTYAAMYPHLVGRMLLDGVTHMDCHYAGK